MSKQDELQYEQQEKRIQAQSDAFITLLTKRGILGDSQIDDAQKRAARQEKTKNIKLYKKYKKCILFKNLNV